MSPLAPVSPHRINSNANDREMLMYLESYKPWDPHPSNVLPDVNPYIVAPNNLPAEILYFCNLEDPRSLRVEGVEAREEGYWQPMGQNLITLTNSPTVGRRTTLKFYTGQAPNGDETDWVMHEYRMEQMGSSLLCRVFLDDCRSLNNVEPQPHIQDDNNAVISGTSVNISSQAVSRNENGQPEVSPNHIHGLRRDRSPQDPPEDFILEGDYLELNNLKSPSISENTSIASMTSDECFDPEALLSDLDAGNTAESVPNMEQQHPDCRFNVSTSQGSHKMVMQPPPSGSLHSNNHLQTKETTASATTPKTLSVPDAPLPPTAALEPKPNLKALNHVPKVNLANEGPSNQRGGASNHALGGKKTAARMAKLGRKFSWCIPL